MNKNTNNDEETHYFTSPKVLLNRKIDKYIKKDSKKKEFLKIYGSVPKILVCTLIGILLILIIGMNHYTIKANKIILKHFPKEMVQHFFPNRKESQDYINLSIKGELKDKKEINSFLFKNPKVSIIIATYNKNKYIKLILRSIQNNPLKDIEIIFVDDCSTDNTVNIIKEYQIEDKRIKIIYNDKNKGSQFTRFHGIIEAKGKYIYLMDADDLLLEHGLNDAYIYAKKNNIDVVQLNFARTNNYNILFFYYNDINRSLSIKNKEDIRNIPKIYTVFVWNMLIKKEIAVKGANYLNNYCKKYYPINYFDDSLLALSILKFSNSLQYLNTPGYVFNKNPNSLCQMKENIEKNNNIAKCYTILLKFLYEFHDGPINNIKLKQAHIMDLHGPTFKNGLHNFNKGFKEMYEAIDLYLYDNKIYSHKVINFLKNYKSDIEVRDIEINKYDNSIEDKNKVDIYFYYNYYYYGFLNDYDEPQKIIENPFIDIVIPINFDEILLHVSLCNIRSQKYKNIGIYIINKTNRTYVINHLKNLIQEDKSIQLITNYTKINFKGKYILFMKPGDILQNKILEKIYNFSLVNNFDLLYINKCKIENGTINNYTKIFNDDILIQFIQNKFDLFNYDELYGKVIKKEIIINSFKVLYNYTKNNIYNFNDKIINAAIALYIKDIKMIKFPGYISRDESFIYIKYISERKEKNNNDYLIYSQYIFDYFEKLELKIKIQIQFNNIINYFQSNKVINCNKNLFNNTIMKYVSYLGNAAHILSTFTNFNFKSILNDKYNNNLFVDKPSNYDDILKNSFYYKLACSESILYDLRNYDKEYSNPRISIIIPLQNREDFILKVIRSIQNQFFEELEIIIINDCTIDGSLEIVKKLQINDKRIKLLEGNNTKCKTSHLTRIIGLKEAKGEYIYFLDSDDFMLPGILNTTYNTAKKHNIDILQFQRFWHIKKKPTSPWPSPIYKNTNKILRREQVLNNNYSPYLYMHVFKNEIIQKGIKSVKENFFNYLIPRRQDYYQYFLFFQQAKIFYIINDFGIYYNFKVKPFDLKNYTYLQSEGENYTEAVTYFLEHKLSEMNDKIDFNIAYYGCVENLNHFHPDLEINNTEYIVLLQKLIKCRFATKKQRKFMKNILKKIKNNLSK